MHEIVHFLYTPTLHLPVSEAEKPTRNMLVICAIMIMMMMMAFGQKAPLQEVRQTNRESLATVCGHSMGH